MKLFLEKTYDIVLLGDMTCTAAIESEAKNIEKIIQEFLNTKISERGQTRIDDSLSDTAMEDRKKQGYFY